MGIYLFPAFDVFSVLLELLCQIPAGNTGEQHGLETLHQQEDTENAGGGSPEHDGANQQSQNNQYQQLLRHGSPSRKSAVEIADLLGAAGVAQLADGLVLDLADRKHEEAFCLFSSIS